MRTACWLPIREAAMRVAISDEAIDFATGGAFNLSIEASAMYATPIPIPELTLEAVTTAEEILVRCSGRITWRTSTVLHITVRSLMPETKCVVLDLTDVNDIDSFGLGALVGVYLSAKRRHCELKVISPEQRVQELIRITKLPFDGRGGNWFEGYWL